MHLRIVTLGLALLLAVCANAARSAGGQRPPNILFVIADDWGLHAGIHGTKWVQTPAFDRVARQGVLFSRAYTPNAKCAPSRATLLTGRNPWQLKDAANHLSYFPPEFKGWVEVLGDGGWFVGHTGKGWGPGVATNSSGGPRQLTGRPFNRRKLATPAKGISNNDYAANFADFLDAAPRQSPWAFWVGTLEPHRGFEFGSGRAKGGKKLNDIDRVPAYWPDTEVVRDDMLDYAFEVDHFDRQLDRILAELDRRGMLENTCVIVTSDHGMPFPRVKGQLYEHASHVPFAVMWKGGIGSPGRVVDELISFVDVVPTIMEVTGLSAERTGIAPTAGRSLVPLLRGSDASAWRRDFVLLGRERQDVGRPNDLGYPVRGLVTKDYLYLHNFAPERWPSGNPETGYLDTDGGATKTAILEAHRKDSSDRFWELSFGKRGAEELYDIRTDPDCVTNLAWSAATEEQRSRFKAQLFAALKAEGDPRVTGQGDLFDRYPHANPQHVKFYERHARGEKMTAGWVNPTDFETRKPGVKRPNIVFFLADDLGQRDLGAYGSRFYETPNIDRLARSGARFTDAYAACPVCSPTRASILTGKYPQRTGVTDYIGAPQPERWKRNTPLLPASYAEKLALHEVTIPEMLKAEGYRTFFGGKWHLGPEGFWPENQGFEVNKGGIDKGGPYGGNKYFSPYGNPRLSDGPPGEHLPDRLASEAIQFMEAHRTEPFFIFLPFYDVHTPLMAREDLKRKYEEKRRKLGLKPVFGDEPPRKVRLVQEHAVYAAMVEAMDEAVGKVLTALERLELSTNTLVIFTSDNGGLSTSEGSPTSNLPLRAGKGWLYEGGVRVPLIIRWPGKVQPGLNVSEPVTSPDFLPTISEVADVTLPASHPRDGVSLILVLQDPGSRRTSRPIFWHYPHYGNQGGAPGAAVRLGEWKLIEWADGRLELFNLARDIGEQKDLAAEQPKLVSDLQAKLRAWQQSVGSISPRPNPAWNPARRDGRAAPQS